MTDPRITSLVDGLPVHGSGERFTTLNPATGAVIAGVLDALEVDVNAAVDAVERGFKVWSAMTGTERGRILHRAAQLLHERNDALAALEVHDTGKPWQEARVVDVASGADIEAGQ